MRCDAGARAHTDETVEPITSPGGAAFHAALQPALWALTTALASARAATPEAVAGALQARAAITEALNTLSRFRT